MRPTSGGRGTLGLAVAAMAAVVACVAAAPASAAHVRLFPLPGSLKHPERIAPGPGGVLWFTQYDVDRDGPQDSVLGQITTGGAATVVGVPEGSVPSAVTIGPDGALWYAAAGEPVGRLGRITPEGLGELVLPRGISAANGIVTAADGALWFTTQQRFGRQRIGRLTPGDPMTFFQVPRAEFLGHIVAGPDGALWFTDAAPTIGRIATTGAVRLFDLPLRIGVEDLAVGADGALWFTSSAPVRIGRITTAGQIRMYRLPDSLDSADAITAGSDGALWFTRTFGIGRITQGGEITELTIPEGEDEYVAHNGIATGPDGAIWFTQQTSDLGLEDDLVPASGQVGRIDLAPSSHQLLVTRITNGPLRGRRGRTLRVSFDATRKASGILRLDLGRRKTLRRAIRADAGANSTTLRLPRRVGAYRLLLRLNVPGQSGSDSASLRISR